MSEGKDWLCCRAARMLEENAHVALRRDVSHSASAGTSPETTCATWNSGSIIRLRKRAVRECSSGMQLVRKDPRLYARVLTHDPVALFLIGFEEANPTNCAARSCCR